MFASIFPALATWVYFVWLVGPPLQLTAAAVGKALQFGFPLVWVLAVQRRRLGLTRPNTRGFGVGIAFGLLVLLAMLLLYTAWLKPSGYLSATSEAGAVIRARLAGLGVDTVWKYAALAAFYALIHSLLEEYYWRWFVFGQLRRLVPLRAALLVSSLAFMAHHVVVLGSYFGVLSAANIVFSLGVAVGGAVWAWIYHRSGSLYAPWASHLIVDTAIFVVGFDLVGPGLR